MDKNDFSVQINIKDWSVSWISIICLKVYKTGNAKKERRESNYLFLWRMMKNWKDKNKKSYCLYRVEMDQNPCYIIL